MDHRNDLQLKTFLLIIKKEGKQTETRELDAYNRDYARRWADLGDTILTSINELEKIGINPVCESNDGEDKVNFEFELETSKGDPFTIYDWKLYRPIGLNEQISFHIGAFTKEASEQAKSELIEALQTI